MRIYCAAPTPYFGDTTGATDHFSSYSCGSRALGGGEVYYRFDSPISGTITATLAAHASDLELIAVGYAGDGGCVATGQYCLAAARASGAVPGVITIQVMRGSTYYLIVDGPAGSASGYTLSFDCMRF